MSRVRPLSSWRADEDLATFRLWLTSPAPREGCRQLSQVQVQGQRALRHPSPTSTVPPAGTCHTNVPAFGLRDPMPACTGPLAPEDFLCPGPESAGGKGTRWEEQAGLVGKSCLFLQLNFSNRKTFLGETAPDADLRKPHSF